MRRRDLLLGGGAVAAIAAAAAMARLVGWRWGKPSTPETFAALPAGSPLLWVAVDVLVPAHGDQPAASETEILPRLDRWVASSPQRTRFYLRNWFTFEEEVRRRLRYEDGRPDSRKLEALFRQWHREYRRERPGPAARFFEQLRRDVLRVYYSSPAGWDSVGYAGPPMRSRPPGPSA